MQRCPLANIKSVIYSCRTPYFYSSLL